MRLIRSTTAGALGLVLLCGLSPPQSVAQAPLLWSGLEGGPYTPGYEVVREYDRSRAFLPERSEPAVVADRLIEVRLWYPAVVSDASVPMQYRGYIAADPEDGPVGPVTEDLGARSLGILRYAAGRYTAGDSAGLVDRLMGMPSGVVRRAPMQPGPFPAIAYSPGLNNPADENAVLAEYLASHGYVVAVVSAVGYESVDETAGPITLETRARDLEYAIRHLRSMANVDQERLGTMGFSYGGMAALLVAMRNPRVDVVVGLDPSFSASQHTPTLRLSPFYDVAKLTVPVLQLRRSESTDLDLSVLDSLRYADRYSIDLQGIDHIDFNSYATAFQSALRSLAAPDSALQHRTRMYEGMAASILAFLDENLRAPSDSRTTLANHPQWDGVPTSAVTLRSSLGLPLPPEPGELLRLFREGRPDAALSLLRDLRDRDPQAAVISEPHLRRMAAELLSDEAFDPAILLLEWSARIHAGLARPLVDLATAHIRAGNHPEAIALLERALEILPGDPSQTSSSRSRLEEVVRNRLRELRGS